jgi:hypothetical protein
VEAAVLERVFRNPLSSLPLALFSLQHDTGLRLNWSTPHPIISRNQERHADVMRSDDREEGMPFGVQAHNSCSQQKYVELLFNDPEWNGALGYTHTHTHTPHTVTLRLERQQGPVRQPGLCPVHGLGHEPHSSIPGGQACAPSGSSCTAVNPWVPPSAWYR